MTPGLSFLKSTHNDNENVFMNTFTDVHAKCISYMATYQRHVLLATKAKDIFNFPFIAKHLVKVGKEIPY